MSNLYQEELMDHYRYPRNRGVVAGATFTHEELNPSCGDVIGLTGKIENGYIVQIAFTGSGCVISQAAASMLTEQVKGLTVTDACKLGGVWMQELVGIPLGPTRLRCALLALQVLQTALK